MADTKSLLKTLKDDPATKALGQAAGKFAAAQASKVVTSGAQRIGGQAGKRAQTGAEEEPKKAKAKKDGGIKGMFSKVTGAMKGLFRRGGAAKRPTNITDEFFIGMPIDKVYAAWTEWDQHAGYMKGVESINVDKVDEDDENAQETQQWRAKIFLSKRSWKSTITEKVENKRIRWTTEAPKGTIDGVITFHRLDDELTLVQYVLEYRPKGLMEWMGNRWRTVGRRARLDMKHFKRHVMLAEQEKDQDQEGSDDVDSQEEGSASGDQEGSPGADEGRPDEDGQQKPEAGGESSQEGEGEDQGEDQGEEEVKPQRRKAPPRKKAA
jgi:uncharacterized membrane protein